MSGDNRQATCEERIGAHLASRLSDFASMNRLVEVYDAETLIAALSGADEYERDELIDSGMFADEIRRAINAAGSHGDESDEYAEALADIPDRAVDDVRESAMQRMDEYPLGASRMIVHRVELSTGGPGDWLEAFADSDAPSTITRVVYHFNDWFDHAERELSGEEERVAADFVARVLGLDL